MLHEHYLSGPSGNRPGTSGKNNGENRNGEEKKRLKLTEINQNCYVIQSLPGTGSRPSRTASGEVTVNISIFSPVLERHKVSRKK
jgi:hypothetical protein